MEVLCCFLITLLLVIISTIINDSPKINFEISSVCHDNSRTVQFPYDHDTTSKNPSSTVYPSLLITVSFTTGAALRRTEASPDSPHDSDSRVGYRLSIELDSLSFYRKTWIIPSSHQLNLRMDETANTIRVRVGSASLNLDCNLSGTWCGVSGSRIPCGLL